jgi:hypothetical protein
MTSVSMNWIIWICAAALATLLLAVVTDLEMTKCHAGSLYAMVRL